MLHSMNDEQRKLAAENHSLVYAFLEENKLPESQFYDVVIFGYLCAVQEYCENPKLRNYKFGTVAWKRMRRELYNHNKYLASQKKAYHTVSLHDTISDGSDLCWEDVLSAKGDVFDQLATDLILHELAKKLPRREMRIIGMKLRGDKMHDIAKSEHLTFSDINRLLNGIYPTVIEVVLG